MFNGFYTLCVQNDQSREAAMEIRVLRDILRPDITVLSFLPFNVPFYLSDGHLSEQYVAQYLRAGPAKFTQAH